MCDVAYVLIVEAVERQVLADRQVAALQAVMSGEGGDLPTVQEAVNFVDAALLAEPVAVADDEQSRLRRALGLS